MTLLGYFWDRALGWARDPTTVPKGCFPFPHL